MLMPWSHAAVFLSIGSSCINVGGGASDSVKIYLFHAEKDKYQEGCSFAQCSSLSDLRHFCWEVPLAQNYVCNVPELKIHVGNTSMCIPCFWAEIYAGNISMCIQCSWTKNPCWRHQHVHEMLLSWNSMLATPVYVPWALLGSKSPPPREPQVWMFMLDSARPPSCRCRKEPSTLWLWPYELLQQELGPRPAAWWPTHLCLIHRRVGMKLVFFRSPKMSSDSRDLQA